MPRTDTNGVSLYYELEGTGERLLVLSGTGGDLRQQPRVSDGPLAEHFEVLAYDQRGLGQSSVPPWPYAMQDFADMVATSPAIGFVSKSALSAEVIQDLMRASAGFEVGDDC